LATLRAGVYSRLQFANASGRKQSFGEGGLIRNRGVFEAKPKYW